MAEIPSYTNNKSESPEKPQELSGSTFISCMKELFPNGGAQQEVVFMDGNQESGKKDLVYGGKGAINILYTVGQEAFSKGGQIPLSTQNTVEEVEAFRRKIKEILVKQVPEIGKYNVFYGKLGENIVIRLLPSSGKDSGIFDKVFQPKVENKVENSTKAPVKAEAERPEANEAPPLGSYMQKFLSKDITWDGQRATCAKTVMACLPEPLNQKYAKLLWVPNIPRDFKEGRFEPYSAKVQERINDPNSKLLVIFNNTYAGRSDHVGIKDGKTFFEMRGGKRKVSGDITGVPSHIQNAKGNPVNIGKDGYDIWSGNLGRGFRGQPVTIAGIVDISHLS